MYIQKTDHQYNHVHKYILVCVLLRYKLRGYRKNLDMDRYTFPKYMLSFQGIQHLRHILVGNLEVVLCNYLSKNIQGLHLNHYTENADRMDLEDNY